MDAGKGWDWASLSSAFFFLRRFLGFSLGAGAGAGGAVPTPISPVPV